MKSKPVVQTIRGVKDDSGVYVVLETRVRLLVTREDFHKGGQLDPGFEQTFREQFTDHVVGFAASDGLTVAVAAVMEFESGDA